MTETHQYKIRRSTKILCYSIMVLGFFLYGVSAFYNEWFPTPMIKDAYRYYVASNIKQQSIEYINKHKETEESLRIETMTRTAHTQMFNPQRVSKGYTLLSMGVDSSALVNNRGQVINTWYMPYSKAFPDPQHVISPLPDTVTFFIDSFVYPNGDLLGLYHGKGDTPYGYGLVKLDKDSNIIWKLALNTHHTLYVSKENGKIYTLKQEYVNNDIPKLKGVLLNPILADSVVIISPEGTVLDSIPIIEALVDTPFESVLYKKYRPIDYRNGDYTHSNSAMVLEESMAKHFPMFKAGQILVSSRNLSMILVIDPETRKVVWALRGIWRNQHEAQFLDNGNILLFDNLGFEDGYVKNTDPEDENSTGNHVRKEDNKSKSSRVLEINPATNEIVWSWVATADQPFYSAYRGSVQKLPNGNYLTTETFPGRQLLEVTPDKEVVWRYQIQPFGNKVISARIFRAIRYEPSYFDADFLGGS